MSFRLVKSTLDYESLSGTKKYKLIMAWIIVLAILLSALYVILSNNYADPAQKWAFGVVGVILGFVINDIIK